MTLFIRSHSSEKDLRYDNLQHNIMHYIIALTNNSLSQSNFKSKKLTYKCIAKVTRILICLYYWEGKADLL